MKRIVLLLGGLSLSTFAMQACSDSSDDPDTKADAGASSGSQGTSSSGAAESGSSSSGGGSTSSGGRSSSSSGGSSGDAQAADRCIQAADRAQARYEACDVNVLILDGGTLEACTDARAADGERIADCVEAASCPALRGDADAGADADQYYQCLGS